MTDLAKEGARLRLEVKNLKQLENVRREEILRLCDEFNPEAKGQFGKIVEKTMGLGIEKTELASLLGTTTVGIDLALKDQWLPPKKHVSTYVGIMRRLAASHQNFLFY